MVCSFLNLNKEILNINIKRQNMNEPKESYLWHCRLGHINQSRVTKLHKQGQLSSCDYVSYETFESCLIGKMTKSPFKRKGERASMLLGLIHLDVYGLLNINAIRGFSYFITFIDDHS